MKVAIIYFEKKSNAKTHVFLKLLQDTAAPHCDSVEILNGYTLPQSILLGNFDYIAVYIAEKAFFSTKPAPAIFTILKTHGLKDSKKGCTLTPKKGLFSGKFIRNTMNALEDIGMRLDYFETIKTEDDIRRAGKNIG
ncbi:MAG: hypothetical protein ACTTH8_05315 [Treponema sp.]